MMFIRRSLAQKGQVQMITCHILYSGIRYYTSKSTYFWALRPIQSQLNNLETLHFRCTTSAELLHCVSAYQRLSLLTFLKFVLDLG
jgi:hypothetical protein